MPYTANSQWPCSLCALVYNAARRHTAGVARKHANFAALKLNYSCVVGMCPPCAQASLAGKAVRARIYLRDATVYAIGGGNSWSVPDTSL